MITVRSKQIAALAAKRTNTVEIKNVVVTSEYGSNPIKHAKMSALEVATQMIAGFNVRGQLDNQTELTFVPSGDTDIRVTSDVFSRVWVCVDDDSDYGASYYQSLADCTEQTDIGRFTLKVAEYIAERLEISAT